MKLIMLFVVTSKRQKIGQMSQNLSSGAFVIGALRVNVLSKRLSKKLPRSF